MEEVIAWEVHIVECSNCCTELLIRTPIDKGDTVVCGRCKGRSTVTSVQAECRSTKGSVVLEGATLTTN